MSKTLVAVLGIAIMLAACSPSTPLLPTHFPSTQPPTYIPNLAETPLPTPQQVVYHDDKAGFSIQHPLTWKESDAGGYPVVFSLTAAPGTTLIDKSMEINATENAMDCKETTYNSDTGTTSPETLTVNGISFLKESGSGIGAGNIYDWTSYSTMKGSMCINVTFVLHSANSGVYSTEPASFDKAVESAIFGPLLNTFKFDR